MCSCPFCTAAPAQTLRARCVAASLWGVLGVAGFLALGGSEGYGEDLRTLTSNGACESNNTFVWLLALGYFSVKGAVMTLAASVRAHLFESRANSAQGGHGPAAAGRMGDGASWWRWQEARWRRESAVTRAAIEFVVASTMLAALVISGGGADQLQLQIETLDERALCRLTVAMWLFWESYLAGMAGMGAGGKAAWSEAQLQRLLRVRAAQEERRQERVARLRRTGS
ncbi:hypothetical protein MNEG_4094 [Monoraphidium neglectum]|uniref:Uncharacterized protein n=1 Tax=Monoraphidium neglectum TaxID=145388 RepID=A0A0D2NFF8_9CHLO|nr:hypothetical protein MNEG_4094 [Monoraphidium neglectum]KIZ03866.1 hypothetical protein MNEG_4094 [Monoraphidium neglectum]|eukprot:XP_013902885.1 hypothetical protein MNEG_4094 [Monoraphidium neglectum]